MTLTADLHQPSDEQTDWEKLDHPPGVRFFAMLVSYLLHPLFIPIYVACFLLFIHPLLFAGYEHVAKLHLLATVFVNLTLLPAVTVFLCWRLKFIDSMYMKTQKERIIPLAAAMIFYFWCWFVLRNFSEIPGLFRQFLLGSFITIIMAWMANIYFKISLHALAAGGLLCFILLLVFSFEGGSAGYLAIAAVVAGLVCSSRLMLDAHRPVEVYSGFILGIVSQVLAVWFS
jgi:hypothetical protein